MFTSIVFDEIGAWCPNHYYLLLQAMLVIGSQFFLELLQIKQIYLSYHFNCHKNRMTEAQLASDKNQRKGDNPLANNNLLILKNIAFFYRYDAYCCACIIILTFFLYISSTFYGINLIPYNNLLRLILLSILLIPFLACFKSDHKISSNRIWPILH